ncbi:MAG: metallophosphoesterase family protein [Thermomicrobiales bacterium]
MRIGLIADIHGNLVALDAVIAELERDRIDQIVCLGDVAALGPRPAEVIAHLRALNVRCVLGNTDAWLVPDSPVRAVEPTTVAVRDLTRWCAERLSTTDVEYLRQLPLTMELTLGGTSRLICFHGSPRSVDDVIAASTPPDALESMRVGGQAALYASGHTHIQLFRRHQQARLINPGSVGLAGVGPGGPELPVNQDVDWAEYAVIDASPDRVTLDLRRVQIDVKRVLEDGSANGMPHIDWWADRWRREERSLR